MAGQIEGMAEFQRRLIEIRKKSPKIAANVLRAGLKVAAKAVQEQIPANLEAAKKTVGSRVDQKASNEQTEVGKIGFGVGRKSNGKSSKSRVRGGVGLSANDVHWFVLGTAERRTKRGFNRGKMNPMLEGVLTKGLASAQSEIVDAMQQQLTTELEKFNQ